MHRTGLLGFGFALTVVLGTAAVAQPICLDSRNIHDSHAINQRTIMFKMIDGARWRATLAQDCPGLVYNGFDILPANSDRVCAGIQTIRSIQNHQICRISTIEPIPPHHI